MFQLVSWNFNAFIDLRKTRVVKRMYQNFIIITYSEDKMTTIFPKFTYSANNTRYD